MKTKGQLVILLLCSAVFGFVSCQCSEDEGVDINSLAGKWSVYNDDSNLAVDGYVEYTFNSDKSCSIYSHDALSDRDTTVDMTYLVSLNHAVITLYDMDSVCTGQYYILKLTSSEMEWKNTTPRDGNSDKKFVKESE